YKTVYSEGYPGVTVRSATVDGKTYFYTVNTDAKPRAASVKVEGKLTERTTGYASPAQSNGQWTITLEPYALRVFELDGGKLADISTEKGK
ncbi:MAG: hypothetical protein IT440_01670, partial [Phycisphaeraceae bacterium]|nr:hypothetical protein [Phycisphaeraceae bacterium]